MSANEGVAIMHDNALLIVVLLMEAVILTSVCTLFYQLLRQQGRILLRLDSVEQRATAGLAAEADPGVELIGLGVGTRFPAFRFPDLLGRTVGLKDFEGKRVLLVHWSADCGFCAAVAKDLALLEDAFTKNNAQIVLLRMLRLVEP
jgi:AhpC/TSA family